MYLTIGTKRNVPNVPIVDKWENEENKESITDHNSCYDCCDLGAVDA